MNHHSYLDVMPFRRTFASSSKYGIGYIQEPVHPARIQL